MLRFLIVLLVSVGFCSASSAQIYALEFKDPKYTKSYKKNLYEWNGRQVVLVEIRGGFETLTPNFTWQPDARLEFFVADPADPLKLPYVLDDGGVKKAVKKQVIGVAAERFHGLKPFMTNESFYTLSVEYQRRLDTLEALKTQRNDAAKGSQEWFAVHSKLVMTLEGLQMWLNQCGYVKAANKLERDLMKATKLGEAAKNERIEAALESIKTVPADDKLKAAATTVGGANLEFKVQESMHIRMIYHSGIPDARVTALMMLGEQAIDAFRVGMVDPYADEEFKDKIPDTLFIEYFFNTESRVHQEKMMEEYYGLGWGQGERRQRSLDMTGSARRIAKRAMSYWRTDEATDFEGVVVHRMGHELARLHYDIRSDEQDWLEEGVGYYLSFNLLNRNNVTCSAFKPPKRLEGTVSKGGPNSSKKSKGETRTQVVMKGLREVMAGVAYHAGTPMSQLTPKKLFAFENEDMAKSWAFFIFINEACGKEGQVWLRGISKIALQDDFQKLLREHTEKCFADIKGDAVTILEERWKEYLQKTYDL
ncbi:MAG: hypothetical protein GY747_13860 [Planctomycetes bacterium]|nr:hypothetical protein [Planctomycetota bacterium]MCP4772373.1 hypothetical protein [Planctomycetota bacterium]MCP4861527.1 hypothetical protein [Planctomycetota bacterium]